MKDLYLRLADHLKDLVMGYPFNEALLDLLREMFSPVEAEVALAIPNTLAPLEVVDAGAILARTHLDASAVSEALASLAGRNMIYSAPTKEGKPGYALLQVGYGMPQTFFWGGKQDDRARKMAKMVLKYFTIPPRRKSTAGRPPNHSNTARWGWPSTRPCRACCLTNRLDPS